MHTQVATLYFDQGQSLLHALVSEVRISGHHKVVASTIVNCNRESFDLRISDARRVYGHANVRAYHISEQE